MKESPIRVEQRSSLSTQIWLPSNEGYTHAVTVETGPPETDVLRCKGREALPSASPEKITSFSVQNDVIGLPGEGELASGEL